MLRNVWLSVSRALSTYRSVPYVEKGKWILRRIPTEQRPNSIAEPTNLVQEHLNDSSMHLNLPKGWRKAHALPQWKRQNFALREKFPEGWRPPRKLNRDEMDELRALKNSQRSLSNKDLADHFKISPEAVRRILKSKWRPTENEAKNQSERWKRRGKKLRMQSRLINPGHGVNSLRKIEDPSEKVF